VTPSFSYVLRLREEWIRQNNIQNTPNNAGNISLTGNNIAVQTNSVLSSATFRRGNAGEILVDATNTVILDNSDITTTARAGAIGNAGQIRLEGETTDRKSVV